MSNQPLSRESRTDYDPGLLGTDPSKLSVAEREWLASEWASAGDHSGAVLFERMANERNMIVAERDRLREGLLDEGLLARIHDHLPIEDGCCVIPIWDLRDAIRKALASDAGEARP